MLDFRIETFLAACRHMNFTAAAEELPAAFPPAASAAGAAAHGDAQRALRRI